MRRLACLLLLTVYVTALCVNRTLTAVSVGDVKVSGGTVNVLFSRDSGEGVRSLRITMHGDSLSVESDGQRRQWFAWRSDTAYYAGEETVNTIEGPRVPVAAFGFPLVSGDSRENTFRIYGMAGKVYRYVREAVYSSEVGGRGSLVLPEGDTIRGVIAVKDILRTETDSIASIRESVRWFRRGERLPVAVYIKEDSTEYCYAIEPYELRNDYDGESDEERLVDEFRSAIESAAVETGAGHIEVRVDFPEISSGGTLSVGVTDVAGHLYALEERAAAGTVSVRIPTSGLRSGEYIIGLSLSRPVLMEKRYISVRP